MLDYHVTKTTLMTQTKYNLLQWCVILKTNLPETLISLMTYLCTAVALLSTSLLIGYFI